MEKTALTSFNWEKILNAIQWRIRKTWK
jgi:hypothetical protein